MKGKSTDKSDENQEYIGNIWGWKYSFISLGIILFFLILMTCRYMALDPQERSIEWEESSSQPSIDSVKNTSD